MIRAIVVDDEPLGRKRILRLLGDHPDVVVVAEAADGRAALAEVLAHRPDLLFLDVQMPVQDGPSALRALRDALPESALPFVVFTTAHTEHALDAFALEAVDYLLKPVEREGLARALKRVRKGLALRGGAGVGSPAPNANLPSPAAAPMLSPPGAPSAPEPGVAAVPLPDSAPNLRRLLAHRGNRTILLDLDQVAAVVVEDSIAWAWSVGGRFRVDGTLQEIATRLPPSFVPVSRAALLRPEAIVELRPLASGTWEATLRDVEGRLHISRRRARELRRLLGGDEGE